MSLITKYSQVFPYSCCIDALPPASMHHAWCTTHSRVTFTGGKRLCKRSRCRGWVSCVSDAIMLIARALTSLSRPRTHVYESEGRSYLLRSAREENEGLPDLRWTKGCVVPRSSTMSTNESWHVTPPIKWIQAAVKQSRYLARRMRLFECLMVH